MMTGAAAEMQMRTRKVTTETRNANARTRTRVRVAGAIEEGTLIVQAPAGRLSLTSMI
jgi:hypothetical protein